MKFDNKRDAKIWCDTANNLWLAVERDCIRIERRCRASNDPRLRALETVLYQMSQQFREELHKRMLWIKDHEHEFVLNEEHKP